MGAFGGLILTNKGRNLQIKAQTGITLNFTKMKIGDGSLSGQSILELNDLINTKKSLDILGADVLSEGRAKLRSYLSNQDIATGFYWRELGIFASDPDEGEVLYCYGNAGINAEYLPAGGNTEILERYINIIILVGNASDVTATLSSEVYVTKKDIEEMTVKINSFEDELNKKASKTYVDDELNNKADKTYVEDELNKKVNKSYNFELQDKDENGIYTTFVEYRNDTTIYKATDLLDPDSNGNYQTERQIMFDEKGEHVIETKTFKLSYDEDNKLKKRIEVIS